MPPEATRPEQVCALVCDGLSDGDLEAAVAQYEATASLAYAPGRTARGHAEIRTVLAGAAASRQLFTVNVRQVLVADDLALVSGEWSGGDPDAGTGRYRLVVRHSAGRWRIAVDRIDAAGARDE